MIFCRLAIVANWRKAMADWLKPGVPKPKQTPETTPELKDYTIRRGWSVQTVYCSETEVNKGGMVQTYQDKDGKALGTKIPASKLRK